MSAVVATLQSALYHNLQAVRDRMARAARAAGREPSEIALLPVTKSVSSEVSLDLARLTGETPPALAENRLEGLEAKSTAARAAGVEVEWHFIGHVQRNKARRVVRLASDIHSVDSERLLEALARIAAEERRRPRIFLQVNATGEAQKHGLQPDEVAPLVDRARAAEHLDLVGLMGMGPLATRGGRPPQQVFGEVAELASELGLGELSMGMTGDLEAAIASGSTLVRVGGALFEGIAGGQATSSPTQPQPPH